jgi:Mrp family chromosome partitioning ATPase
MAGWDGPPILGEFGNASSLKAADYVIDWPASRFAHASAALVRQLEAPGDGAVIALTATEPGDAKSVVAVAVARAAAAMGKRAVIVDLDPAARATAALGAEAPAGLYEVLTGSVKLNDALVRDRRSGAFLLTLRQRPARAAMLASPQMHRLLEILRDGCDLVVVNCGLALQGTETALIARQADATLLVSRRARLRGRSVAHAATVLEEAQAAPLGLVLAG